MKLWIVALCLMLCPSITCAAELDLPRENWMAEYSHGNKTGYRYTRVDRTTFLGQSAYHWHELREMWIRFGDQIVAGRVTDDVYLTPSFEPIAELLITRNLNRPASGGDWKETDPPNTYTATYGTSKIECRRREDGGAELVSVPVPKDTDFASAWRYRLGAAHLSAGDEITGSIFVPPLCQIMSESVSIRGPESVQIGGQTYDALVMTSDRFDTRWLSPDRVELQYQDGNDPRDVLVCTNREDAVAIPQDLWEASVKVEPPIPDPQNVAKLTIRITGFPLPLQVLPDDDRQSSRVIGDRAMEYQVVAREFDASESVERPVEEAKYRQYLVAAPGVEVDEPTIQNLAREIAGEEKNAYRAARKLSSWVHENIDSSGEDPADSALAALNARSGSCRHFALLYTALARAAGIPTRVVSGFMVADRYLVFHGWAESYVGEWVAVDPTVSLEFVDAAHIKLKEGTGAAVVAPFTLEEDVIARGMKAHVLSYTTTDGDKQDVGDNAAAF